MTQKEVLSNISDEKLLADARRLDGGALTKIFDFYSPRIYKYVLRLCNGNTHRAEDIVGDVFAQLIDQFALQKGPHTNLRSYLFQTAYHLVVDESREPVTSMLYEELARPSIGLRPVEEQLDHREIIENINKARNSLSQNQQDILSLRFDNGLSLKETAASLHKDVNNIKVTQNHGINNVRNRLGRTDW